MGHQDAELSDVVIVLLEEMGLTMAEAVKQLAGMGLEVSEVKEEEGIVEGTIETVKVSGLKGVEFVKYVRMVFNYTADYPQGDPRNLDKDEDELPSEADDAGA